METRHSPLPCDFCMGRRKWGSGREGQAEAVSGPYFGPTCFMGNFSRKAENVSIDGYDEELPQTRPKFLSVTLDDSDMIE